MPFMMMKMNKQISLFIGIIGLLSFTSSIAQTNRLTGSPYSLFGLGIETGSNVGKNAALGRAGYALYGQDFINLENPASFGTQSKNRFIFDIGFLGELSSLENANTEENRLASNFSSLAFLASVDEHSSFGLSLSPYSDVGYSLVGIESNVEGSFDQFVSNIFGTGALNGLTLSYGRSFWNRIRLGAKVTYLFGSIEETEAVFAGISGLTVVEESSYRGLQLGLGLQTDIASYLSYGFTVNFPTELSGNQDRIVQKTLDLVQSPVESETDIDLDPFDLPFEINNGILVKPWQQLSLNLDYSLKFWEATGQTDNVGDFINQSVFSGGAEFIANSEGFKYFQRVQLRAGMFYDTGYLSIRGEDISSMGFSFGIGFPLSRRTGSRINLSYTNIARGSTNGILVDENINSVNLNITLKDIWFLKRKID